MCCVLSTQHIRKSLPSGLLPPLEVGVFLGRGGGGIAAFSVGREHCVDLLTTEW